MNIFIEQPELAKSGAKFESNGEDYIVVVCNCGAPLCPNKAVLRYSKRTEMLIYTEILPEAIIIAIAKDDVNEELSEDLKKYLMGVSTEIYDKIEHLKETLNKALKVVNDIMPELVEISEDIDDQIDDIRHDIAPDLLRYIAQISEIAVLLPLILKRLAEDSQEGNFNFGYVESVMSRGVRETSFDIPEDLFKDDK